MKNTKTKSIVALAIVLVLTVVFGIVGVTGMSFQGGLWKLLPQAVGRCNQPRP